MYSETPILNQVLFHTRISKVFHKINKKNHVTIPTQ